MISKDVSDITLLSHRNSSGEKKEKKNKRVKVNVNKRMTIRRPTVVTQEQNSIE